MQQTHDFVADDPATTRTAEPTSYRSYTEEVENIPLPSYSAATRELSERHYPLAFHRYQELTDDIKKRVRDAMEQIARTKSKIIIKTYAARVIAF